MGIKKLVGENHRYSVTPVTGRARVSEHTRNGGRTLEEGDEGTNRCFRVARNTTGRTGGETESHLDPTKVTLDSATGWGEQKSGKKVGHSHEV